MNILVYMKQNEHHLFVFKRKPPTFIRRHCIRNPCVSSIDVILPLEELSALAALPTRFLFSWSVEILVSA